MTIPLFIHSRKQLSSTRNFDVCLLKMLDNLNTLSSGPLKTLSQSWLVHAMARGDVARILEPLLITLLDPTTARVSILFCHVRQVASPPSTDTSCETAAADGGSYKIYAISCSNNETIHHVSSSRKPLDCSAVTITGTFTGGFRFAHFFINQPIFH